MSIATGLRKQNVLKLRRSEVHWDMGIIQVVQKMGSVHRAVLTDDLRMILSAIPDNGTDFYWINHRSKDGKPCGKPYGKVEKSYKTCLRAAGVDPTQFRFHDLRHHAISKVVRNFGLLAGKEFAGHSSIQNTLRYAHLEKKDHAANINRIGIHIPDELKDKVLPFKKKVG